MSAENLVCNDISNSIFGFGISIIVSNTSFFRCGRTARIGNEGQALLFLLPNEDAYVDFIRINQKVELRLRGQEPEAKWTWSQVTNQVRSWERNDRSVFDKANRAFVSYIQAYKKHECNWVLRLKGEKP